MDEKKPSPDCQKCITGKLFHFGEMSGMIDILEGLSRGCIVLQTVQQAHRHEITASAIDDLVAGDGGFGFKRMVARLQYDSTRSCADKSVSFWQ